MQNTNLTSLNLFANKVNIYLDMFGSLVLNRVSGEIYCANVITINQRSAGKWVAEFK